MLCYKNPISGTFYVLKFTPKKSFRYIYFQYLLFKKIVRYIGC